MDLGLLSNSSLNPKVYWSTVIPPLFSSMAEQPGVRTISPPFLTWENRSEWMRTRSEVRACDTFFWVQLSSRPAPPIHAAAFLKLKARRSAMILDAWTPAWTKIGLSATLQRLDPCFVAYRHSTEELTRRFPLAKFVWLPFGCDTTVFYPRRQEKTIFAFWMGRRDEPLHRALTAYCEARGLRYVFQDNGSYTTEELGSICSSSRYFVVTPPHASRSGGFSPLVQRYFEGLAAGTRLLGVLPEGGDYQMFLPTEAMCVVKPDGSDLAERLDADRRLGDHEAITERVAAFVREHHSWGRRGEQIYDHLASAKPIELRSMGSDGRVRNSPSASLLTKLAVS
jgi:hypothetical protein